MGKRLRCEVYGSVQINKEECMVHGQEKEFSDNELEHNKLLKEALEKKALSVVRVYEDSEMKNIPLSHGGVLAKSVRQKPTIVSQSVDIAKSIVEEVKKILPSSEKKSSSTIEVESAVFMSLVDEIKRLNDSMKVLSTKMEKGVIAVSTNEVKETGSVKEDTSSEEGPLYIPSLDFSIGTGTLKIEKSSEEDSALLESAKKLKRKKKG